MTRARTLADMISDGVIGTTELADDAITPVKLDETGNYTIAQLDVNGTVTSDGLTVAGIATVQDSDVRIDLTAAPSASGEVIGDLYFRSENSYGGRQDAGLIRSISASNWNVSREAAMEFHTTYNSTMSKRMRINNNGDIVFYNADGSTTSFLYDADVGSFFNYAGHNRDFRISSDNQTNMFAIDGGNDQIGFGRSPLSGGSGATANEGAIQIADGLGTVPLFINGGADYAGMKLKRDGTNAAGGTDGWNWTIRPSYASGVASGGDISYLKINSVYDAGQGGQLQHEVVFNEDQYNLDFRVESDNNANMFFVDASQNRVLIGDTNLFGDTAFQIYQNSGSTSNVRGMTIRNASASVGSQAGMLFVNYDNIGAKIHSRRTGSTEGDLRIQINTGGSTTEASLQDAIRVLGSTGSTQSEIIFNEGAADMNFRLESENNSSMIKVDAAQDNVGIGKSPGSGQGTLQIAPQAAAVNYYRPAGNYALFGDSGGNGETDWIYLSGSYTNTGKSVGFAMQDYNGNFNQYAGSYIRTEAARVRIGHFIGGANSGTAPSLADNFTFDTAGGAVFNERGETGDFRVESDTDTHAIFVDAGNNRVNIHASSGENLMNLNAAGVSSHTSGTLPPGLTLYNSNTGDGTGNAITWKDATGAQGIAGIASFRSSSAGGYARDLRFYVNNQAATNAFQERVRINRDGMLKVGQSLSSDLGGYLQVIRSSGGDQGNDCLSYFETSGNDWVQTLNYNNASGTKYFLQFKDRGTVVGSVRGNSTSTSYYTSSDHRLKENIVDLAGATERVKQLQPKRFSWIIEEADAPTVDGFLAHEAQTVVPEAVHGTHNEVDDDGNPVYQGIDQAKLVPLLTAALQEAITKIETLETQRADMEARLTALESA